MKFLIKIVYFSILSVLIANNADNNKKGFIIGFGGGFHNGIVQAEQAEQSMSFNHNGASSDFKIGFSPLNNCEIYYSHKGSYFKNNDTNFMTESSGLGLTFFLNPKFFKDNKWHPSTFIAVTYGRSDYGRRDGKFSYDHGKGYSFSIGYEYTPKFRIQLNYVIGDELNSDYFDPEIRMRTSNINLSMNYMYSYFPKIKK